MKKFNFTLQKVLEIKEQYLENFKMELSDLYFNLSSIEKHIDDLHIKYSEINKEFNIKTCKSISAGEMSYYKVYMNSILKQIENKEEERLLCQKKIEAKTQEIIKMNTEISSMEKLKEKELEKYNKIILKNEEIFIEEFVSNKSLTKKLAI